MRILICGSAERGSNNLWIINSFKKMGHDVSVVNDEKEYKDAISFARLGTIIYKAINKYGVKIFSGAIQKRILELTHSFKPHLVYVIKGYYLSPNTLKKIKQIDSKIVIACFNPDSPFCSPKWHLEFLGFRLHSSL